MEYFMDVNKKTEKNNHSNNDSHSNHPTISEQLKMAKKWVKHLIPEHFEHCSQVSFLGTRLFDKLKALHHLGKKERYWLELAGFLHDIGWVDSQIQHHKTALKMIMENTELFPDPKNRIMVGLISRYHRKAFPKPEHKYFKELTVKEKDVVMKLAALIRLADGMDWEHISNTRDLSCQIKKDYLEITCNVKEKLNSEIDRAIQKAAYFLQVFDKKIKVFQVNEKNKKED